MFFPGYDVKNADELSYQFNNRKLHNAHVSFTESRNVPILTFPVNPYLTCERNASWTGGKSWDLVVIVVSEISNFFRRSAIRNTWGSTAEAINAKVLFLVGKDRNRRLQPQVEKEAELFNDVIQVDIIDDYFNLTYKSIAMLQWFSDYCQNSKAYFKVDDDVYANLENIVQRLKLLTEERFFFCHVFEYAPPVRNVHSKYYVSKEEYPDDYFPPYCSGTGYVFSSSIVYDLMQKSLESKIFKMEDVFLTGLAAKGMNIRHIHDGAFSFYKREPTGCAFENALTGHEMSVKQMFVIFAQLQSKEIDCETKVNRYLEKVEQM